MGDLEEPSCRKISVLFVCLGNICRSPMAEAVFRSLTYNLPPTPSNPSTTLHPHPQISRLDSAGTGAYHALSPPDPRTLSTLRSHGIHTYEHCARKITAKDFEEFDYIMAMDRENLADLEAVKMRLEKRGRLVEGKGTVRLFGEFGGEKGGGVVGEEVVDPYYGADNGFEVVFEQVERFSKAFLREVVEKPAMEPDGREADDNEERAVDREAS